MQDEHSSKQVPAAPLAYCAGAAATSLDSPLELFTICVWVQQLSSLTQWPEGVIGSCTYGRVDDDEENLFLCFSIDRAAMQQKKTNVHNMTPTRPIMWKT